MTLTIRNAADAAELDLFGAIGAEYGGITAKDVSEALKTVKASTLRVYVHSPGGNAFDGVAIANMLAQQRTSGCRVETINIGLAASAATAVLVAGNPVKAYAGSLAMVHLPYAWTIGTAADHAKVAEALEAVTDSLIACYRWRSTQSESQLRALMETETWMDASEQLANGFATEVVRLESDTAAAAAAARWPSEVVAALGQVPARYRDRFARFAGLRASSARPGQIDMSEIYARRRQPSTNTPPARPTSIADVAARYYGARESGDASLISTTRRGA